MNGNNESSMTRCCLVLPSVAEHHCVPTDTLRFSNFLPKSQNQLRLCARCPPPGYETPFGWAVHLKMGARVWIFDIRTNGNMLKILRCCIINIQPDDFPEFPSATLYYMNCFVNCQTNNTKYSSNVYGNKHEHSGIYWGSCQRYQTNNKLLNIVI